MQILTFFGIFLFLMACGGPQRPDFSSEGSSPEDSSSDSGSAGSGSAGITAVQAEISSAGAQSGSQGKGAIATKKDDPKNWYFNKHIKPIFERRCNMCHKEGSDFYASTGNTSWESYDLIYAKRDSIHTRVFSETQVGKKMPWVVPTVSEDLTEQERQILREWLDKGAPQK